MAKNRTMAQKHLKAKKDGIKEVITNTYSFMASARNMSESAKWTLNHKPDYSTTAMRLRIAQLKSV